MTINVTGVHASARAGASARIELQVHVLYLFRFTLAVIRSAALLWMLGVLPRHAYGQNPSLACWNIEGTVTGIDRDDGGLDISGKFAVGDRIQMTYRFDRFAARDSSGRWLSPTGSIEIKKGGFNRLTTGVTITQGISPDGPYGTYEPYAAQRTLTGDHTVLLAFMHGPPLPESPLITGPSDLSSQVTKLFGISEYNATRRSGYLATGTITSYSQCACQAPPGEPTTMRVAFTGCPAAPGALFSTIWGGNECINNSDPSRPCGIGATLTAVNGEALNLSCEFGSIRLRYASSTSPPTEIGWCPYVGGVDRISIGIGGWDKERQQPRCFTSARFESTDGGLNDPDDPAAGNSDLFLRRYGDLFPGQALGPEATPLLDRVLYFTDFSVKRHTRTLFRYNYQRSNTLCLLAGICCSDSCNRFGGDNIGKSVFEKSVTERMQ